MRSFTALYTHQKQKKAKTWQDGLARYNSEANEIILFDTSNSRIASHRLRAKETIELSIEYDVGRYLLTLEEEQGLEGANDRGSTVNGSEVTILESCSKPGSSRGRIAQHPASKLSRGSKRPASLIKPIKLKLDSGSEPKANSNTTLGEAENRNSSSSSSSSSGAKDESQEHDNKKPKGYVEFTVLYTTQKIKKAKTWSDGTMQLDEADHHIVLRDENGGTLTSTRLPKSKAIEIGSELDSGMYLIQIECLKGDESNCMSVGKDEPVLQLQGKLKRQHNSLFSEAADPLTRPKLARKGLQKIKLSRQVSSVTSSDSEPAREIACAVISTVPSVGVNVVAHKKTVLKRAPFAPPESQTPQYLHFPKRGELLQHVSVSKGYGFFGPPRRLVAPVGFTDWTIYQKKFSELLRENLMAELSALAIRYFFMAREKHEGSKQLVDSSSVASSGAAVQKHKPQWKRKGHSKFGSSKGPSLAQACKSVGVLFFDDCTVRQPFLDSTAYKAQRSKGAVAFAKGDSIVLELSRRENYVGYSKDDTWAISTSENFGTETTLLARSVFFGPSKNNTLELTLVGNDDARVLTRIFNNGAEKGSRSSAGMKRMGAAEKAVSGIVAVRCLDSASDWSMIDSIEDGLSPTSLPILPHLLEMQASTQPLPLSPSNGLRDGDVLDWIAGLLKEKRSKFGLNDNQFDILRQVVMSAVSIYIPVKDTSPITVVHGPFGTGKSFMVSVIVICLDEIANEFPSIFNSGGTDDQTGSFDGYSKESSPATPLRVLVSSMTNFAVDNMLAALLKQGYDQFLRVGNLKRISKQILPYVCRSSSSAAEDIKELETMLEVTNNESERDAICSAIQRLRQQRSQEAIDNTFVIGTTCLSAGAAALQSASFPLVILDEACQIVEPMALIALVNARCQRLVVVGDPLQLPPTLTTRATKEAEGKGLDRALFDRLVEMGHGPQFLSTQYRCHPRIGSLCSQLFYGGRLLHGITKHDRPPLVPGIPPLSFLDTAGQEKQQGKSQSFFNKGEIDMAVQLTRRLVQGGVSPESIGIIALYKTQADMLKDQLASFLGERARVQVSTVDAYQGSEREVIILSCVRTSKIGFISNPNRINVALSRARTHCVILGCRRLLETNAMWRRIIEYCREDETTGLGAVSAQVFLNQLCVSAAAHGTEEGADELHETSGYDTHNGTVQRSMSETHCAGSGSELEDAAFGSADDGKDSDNADDSDEDDSNDLDEIYPDEGVVGGLLSQQWSLPSLGYADQLDEITASVDDDLIDCLDIDLDDI